MKPHSKPTKAAVDAAPTRRTDVQTPLPWQQAQWQQVHRWVRAQRVPQAVLLCGPAGVGKQHFAEAALTALLCTEAQKQTRTHAGQETETRDTAAQTFHACGQCKSCLLILAGNHPDYTELTTDTASGVIKIDQVRSLLQVAQQTPQLSAVKVVLIAPVEHLHPAAAHALLKSIEEPSAGTLFLLITHERSRVLPTLQSRCQPLSFIVPAAACTEPWLAELVQTNSSTHSSALPLSPRAANEQARAALHAACGKPLLALKYQQEQHPLISQRVALMTAWAALILQKTPVYLFIEQWGSWPFDLLLKVMQSWLADILKIKMGVSSDFLSDTTSLSDTTTMFQQLADRLSVEATFNYWDSLNQARHLYLQTTSLNTELLLLDTLIRWQRLNRPST